MVRLKILIEFLEEAVLIFSKFNEKKKKKVECIEYF